MSNDTPKQPYQSYDALNCNSPLSSSHINIHLPKQESPPSQYNEISIENQKSTLSYPIENQESLYNDDFQNLVQLKLNAIKLKRSRAQSQQNTHSTNSIQYQPQNKPITLNDYQSTFTEGKDFIVSQYEKTVDDLRDRLAKSNEEKRIIELNASKSIATLNKLIQRIS